MQSTGRLYLSDGAYRRSEISISPTKSHSMKPAAWESHSPRMRFERFLRDWPPVRRPRCTLLVWRINKLSHEFYGPATKFRRWGRQRIPCRVQEPDRAFRIHIDIRVARRFFQLNSANGSIGADVETEDPKF